MTWTRRGRAKLVSIGSLATLLLVAGCSSDGGDSPQDTGSTDEGQGAEVTPGAEDECGTGEISFMPTPTPASPISWWEEVADRFESAHPGITVEVVEATGPVIPYMQQLMATGGFPDVFLGTNPPAFTGGNPLRPFEISGKIADLAHVNDVTYEGDLYYPPTYILPSGLVFYNETLLAEAGVTELPTTVAEFESVLAALADAGITPLIMGGDWSLRAAFLELFLGDIMKENPTWFSDREAGEASFLEGSWPEAAQTFVDWNEAGYIDPATRSLDFTSAQQAFLEGKAALYPLPSFFTANPEIPDNIGVFQMPTSDGTPVIGVQYVGFGVAAESEHPEAAVCLAKWLSFDPEFQVELMSHEGWYSNLATPPSVDRTELQAEIGAILQESQALPWELGWGENTAPNAWRGEMEPVLQGLLAGSTTIDQAMADLEASWDTGN